jgi:hypothetical protein
MPRRDHWAGCLVAFIGVGIGYGAVGYKIGTLRQMGPGFFPLMLAVILVVVGVMIAATPADAAEQGHDPAAAGRTEWVGCACIVGGVLAFILLAERTGMLPATFVSVFISSLGDRDGTLTSSLLLAGAVTVFAVLLFFYGLQIQLPLLTW